MAAINPDTGATKKKKGLTAAGAERVAAWCSHVRDGPVPPPETAQAGHRAATAIRAGRATSLATGTGYTTDTAIRAAHLAALPLAKRADRAKEMADRLCDVYEARPGRGASIEAFARFCESLDG